MRADFSPHELLEFLILSDERGLDLPINMPTGHAGKIKAQSCGPQRRPPSAVAFSAETIRPIRRARNKPLNLWFRRRCQTQTVGQDQPR